MELALDCSVTGGKNTTLSLAAFGKPWRLLLFLAVQQPEPPNSNADTNRRSNRNDDLRDELAVLHPDFLSQSLDLNGHEVNP